MKINFLFILLIFFLAGCYSSNSSQRSDIVIWAKQVANLEKRLESEINQFTLISDSIVSRPPTNEELSQLTKRSNNIAAIYNEIVSIDPPSDVKNVHNKYIDSYAKTANFTRYYVIAVKQNDISYFDKSVIAAQDANSIGVEAYDGFERILENYSISCREIDFCE